MPLPRLVDAPWWRSRTIDDSGTPAPGFRVRVCTVPLGASDVDRGHARLEHCFAKLEDARGRVIGTLSFGRSGLAREPWPELPSATCVTQAAGLDAPALQGFVATMQALGRQPYRWGSHDCCSCLAKAVASSLRRPVVALVEQAAGELARSPEFFV